MNKKYYDDFFVFEVIDGWLLSPNFLTQVDITKEGTNSLRYLDDKHDDFFQKLDWSYDTVKLTPDPLAAISFDNISDDFSKNVLSYFPSGKFKKIIVYEE